MELYDRYHANDEAIEKLEREIKFHTIMLQDKKYATEWLWSDAHAYEIIEEKSATIILVRQLKATIKPEAQKENTEQIYEWGTFRTDYADERYRFIFDGKPEQEVIALMKSNGFKWSPSNKAWQRQITGNAAFAIKHYIMPKLAEIYKTEI